jgi:hypothetical protein
MNELMLHSSQNNFTSFDELKKSISTKITRSEWLNIGGQLIKKDALEKLKKDVKSGKIQSWNKLHETYKTIGENYTADKLEHAYTSLLENLNLTFRQFTSSLFKELLSNAIATKEWMCKGIYESREKDYTNPFRKMIYDTQQEMNKVIGKLEDNTFIQQQLIDLDAFKKEVKQTIKKLGL